MTEVRYLTSEDVVDLATVDEYVDVVRDGYRQRGEGAPARPRTQLFSEEPAGSITSYLAILPETGAMGGYTYSAGFAAGDAWFALPLFDAESGALVALLEGAAMNPLKTGAVGAVGVDALAREDVTVRDFERVSVYSPTKAHREAFAAEFNDDLDATVAAVASSAAAVEDADVVITATRATEPVFDGELLPDGAHVTAMGQYHPQRRELDATTIQRSVYVPDLRQRAFQDAGSFLLAREEGAVDDDHVQAELGEVVAGEAPGRTSPDDVTVFDSGGTAIETVAAGYMLYERAVEAGRGELLEFPQASDWL